MYLLYTSKDCNVLFQTRTAPKHLRLILRFTSFIWSISRHNALPGSVFLGLEYSNCMPRKFRPSICAIGRSMAMKILFCGIWSLMKSDPFAEKTKTILTIPSYINYVLFLLYGSYPDIWNRLFGVEQIPKHSDVQKRFDLDFLNRQFLWQSFSVKVCGMYH